MGGHQLILHLPASDRSSWRIRRWFDRITCIVKLESRSRTSNHHRIRFATRPRLFSNQLVCRLNAPAPCEMLGCRGRRIMAGFGNLRLGPDRIPEIDVPLS